jgi:hypothetical protein
VDIALDNMLVDFNETQAKKENEINACKRLILLGYNEHNGSTIKKQQTNELLMQKIEEAKCNVDKIKQNIDEHKEALFLKLTKEKETLIQENLTQIKLQKAKKLKEEKQKNIDLLLQKKMKLDLETKKKKIEQEKIAEIKIQQDEQERLQNLLENQKKEMILLEEQNRIQQKNFELHKKQVEIEQLQMQKQILSQKKQQQRKDHLKQHQTPHTTIIQRSLEEISPISINNESHISNDKTETIIENNHHEKPNFALAKSNDHNYKNVVIYNNKFHYDNNNKNNNENGCSNNDYNDDINSNIILKKDKNIHFPSDDDKNNKLMKASPDSNLELKKKNRRKIILENKLASMNFSSSSESDEKNILFKNENRSTQLKHDNDNNNIVKSRKNNKTNDSYNEISKTQTPVTATKTNNSIFDDMSIGNDSLCFDESLFGLGDILKLFL